MVYTHFRMRTLSLGATISSVRGAIVKNAAVSLHHYIYALIDLFFLFVSS